MPAQPQILGTTSRILGTIVAALTIAGVIFAAIDMLSKSRERQDRLRRDLNELKAWVVVKEEASKDRWDKAFAIRAQVQTQVETLFGDVKDLEADRHAHRAER